MHEHEGAFYPVNVLLGSEKEPKDFKRIKVFRKAILSEGSKVNAFRKMVDCYQYVTSDKKRFDAFKVWVG